MMEILDWRLVSFLTLNRKNRVFDIAQFRSLFVHKVVAITGMLNFQIKIFTIKIKCNSVTRISKNT